jgi:hypothetical protein
MVFAGVQKAGKFHGYGMVIFFLSFFDLLDPEKKGWDRFFHFRCWGAKLATRGISSRSYRELNPDGLARICVMKIGDTTDL